jgi:HAD superfamily hydrolase (TIGR01509 family)
MIKALFVDIGGVIVVNRAREVGEKYLKSDGLTKEITSKIFRYIQTDKRSDEELVKFLRDENVEIELWNRFTREFYASEARNDDLINLLKEAKSKGILIIVTTNNSDKVMKGMEKYQIGDLSEVIINSSDYRVAKPDREYWEVALREARKFSPNINPDEILVIDDSESNCISAKEFGLNIYNYRNSEVAKKEIAKIILS